MDERWIELDPDERKELTELLWRSSSALYEQEDVSDEGSEDERRYGRLKAQVAALAERIEDGVPLTSADVRAALRFIQYQGWDHSPRAKIEQLTIILRSRCVNAQRKATATPSPNANKG